jgi:hypothetical protein
MTATTRERDFRAGPKPVRQAKRKQPAEAAQPVARERSRVATLALDAFGELRRFFGHDVQLAQALNWDDATAAQWRDRLVVRPQRTKVRQVLLLNELAGEARAYLATDTDVGDWLNAPLPNLRGSSPANWIRSRERIGLRELTHGMVDWMPRLPDRDLEPIDAQEAQAYLDEAAGHDAGAAELKRMLAALAQRTTAQ